MYLEVVGAPRSDARARSRASSAPLDRFVHRRQRRRRSPRTPAGCSTPGATRVEFGTPQGLTTRRGVELLCDRVLPLLRGVAELGRGDNG